MKKKINVIKYEIKYLIVAMAIYLVFIIIGIICFLNSQADSVFYGFAFDYYIKIFDCQTSPISLLFTRLLNNLGYILVFFALGFVIYTYPLKLLIIAYRGAIIGSVSIVFINLYGFNGFIVFMTVVLPQNIITTLGLCVFSLLNLYQITDVKCNGNNIKVFAENAAIGFAFCFIGALYEFLILVILIRPMNFYF
ncbi:MAG: hypothetical protein IJ800_03850 [Clostridia bacterium]|nr:hypothetical protein [Clostridia bacterium]